jgi:hypothetical protein
MISGISASPSRRRERQVTSPMPPILITRKVLAEMLGGFSNDSLRKLEKQGDLHPVKFSDMQQGHVRYSLAEVEALVARSKRSPAPKRKPGAAR